jgi:hypothetical protein
MLLLWSILFNFHKKNLTFLPQQKYLDYILMQNCKKIKRKYIFFYAFPQFCWKFYLILPVYNLHKKIICSHDIPEIPRRVLRGHLRQ